MKLAADANVLLSAVLGGQARLVLRHPQIDEVFTTESTYAEVQEYATLLGRKKNLAPDALMFAVAALPVSIVGRDVYRDSMAQARKLIGWRDPDDVELLALALHSKTPLWSNDEDFSGCGIEVYPTAVILQKLGIFGKR